MLNVKETAAYKNRFFELSAATVQPSEAELALVVREWFPVTQAFCLNLPNYNALIAQEILATSGARRERLELAMLTPIQITAEEFGLGQFGLAGIHYRMFARLGEPLGISLADLQANPFGHQRETTSLVLGIRESFDDLYQGAACIRVVEGTAYEIVRSMSYIFGGLSRGIESVYTEQQLEYIALHLEIEKEHDCLASRFVDHLCDDEHDFSRLNFGLLKMSSLFGEFWAALSEIVFPARAEPQSQVASKI